VTYIGGNGGNFVYICTTTPSDPRALRWRRVDSPPTACPVGYTGRDVFLQTAATQALKDAVVDTEAAFQAAEQKLDGDRVTWATKESELKAAKNETPPNQTKIDAAQIAFDDAEKAFVKSHTARKAALDARTAALEALDNGTKPVTAWACLKNTPKAALTDLTLSHPKHLGKSTDGRTWAAKKLGGSFPPS
jgi:hypothetical protein